MTSTLKVDQIQLADGSVPTAGDLGLNVSGSVLQVVSVTTDLHTTSSVQDATFTAINGLSASITPKSVNSKILVSVFVGKASNAAGNTSSGDRQINFRLKRGSTDIGLGATYGSRVKATFSILDGPHHVSGRGGTAGSYQILDEPNTVSAITYSLYGSGHAGETWTINRAAETNDSTDAPQSTTSSTITLTEIAG